MRNPVTQRTQHDEFIDKEWPCGLQRQPSRYRLTDEMLQSFGKEKEQQLVQDKQERNCCGEHAYAHLLARQDLRR